jgi:hypothetical protein
MTVSTTPAQCTLGCQSPEGAPYPTVNGWQCCDPCADRLAGLLGDLHDHYATLTEADELIPRSAGERGSPGFGPRSPAVDAILVHTDIRTRWTSEAGSGALAAVSEWARMIREDLSLDTPAVDMLRTVPAGRATMNRELATIRFHWDWVLRQPWLDQFADDMRDVLHSLKHVGRLNERWMCIGPCPVIRLVDVGEYGAQRAESCGAMLRVKANAGEIICRKCGTVWPRGRWHELGDPWTDYAALSNELGVPVGTLWRWASEDRWATAGTRARRLVFRTDAIASYERRRGGLVA